MTERYRAFISYSHADERWARWLHRGLETYRVPGRIVAEQGLATNRLLPIFRDREELGSSGDLSATIRTALAESANLIVICSPAAAQSTWVNREVEAFQQLGKGDRVFCLLVDDPARSFPPATRRPVDNQGLTEDVEIEPLAADARPDADGRAGAKLKLISGLLDVRLDDLRQREHRRRQKRLALITAGSVVGMVFAIALSVFALISRNEATRQQARAEREAATAQQVTDFLVDLFRSSDPFAEQGADLTVKEVLARGADKIDGDLAAEPLVQARLMSTIGSVYSSLGLFNDAELHLKRAAVLQADLLAPGATETLETQIQRAWAALQRGDNTLAMEIYQTVLPLSEVPDQFVHPPPDTPSWALAVNDYGVLLRNLGQVHEARAVLEQALAMYDRIDEPPTDDVASTLSNLGLVSFDTSAYERARSYFEKALAVQSSKRGDMHPSLTLMLMNYGSALRQLKDYETAKTALTRALAIAEANFEPDHPAFGAINNSMGVLLHRTGDLDLAQATLERAGDVIRLRLGDNHTMTAANLQHQARVFVARQDWPHAEALYRRSMSSYISAVGPEHLEVIGVYVELAEVMEQRGVPDDADVLFERALAIARQHPGAAGYLDYIEGRHDALLAGRDGH